MNNVPFDTVPEYYNYHPSWKEIFPYPIPWTNVIFLCCQVNTEMEDFAASGGMTGQAWCSRVFYSFHL
jgi:hypothetical protein